MVLVEFGGSPFADIQEPANTPQSQQTSQFNIVYPLISSPLTPDAKIYNNMIKAMAVRWWADIGAPADISSNSSPRKNFQLDCTPGGGTLNDDRSISGEQPMLPGVISLMCFYYIRSDTRELDKDESSYNWILAQHRTIRPSDVFRANSGWLNFLTETLTDLRNNAPAPPGNFTLPFDPRYLPPYDFSNTRHWLITSSGLGFAYDYAYFTGYYVGKKPGIVTIIPWSKLRPYLNPHGIVPKADWNATLPIAN